MKKVIIYASIIFSLLTAVSVLLYCLTEYSTIIPFAVTFGTTAYHFVMRLAVGYSVNAVMHNRADYLTAWFKPQKFEKKLYQILRVKAWKTHMPSYDPTLFSLKVHSPEEIVGAMCQAEIVHEIIALLSFLPLSAIPIFGEPFVFAVTSLMSACFDLMFVIMQRYNRPRIIKLISRGNKNV